MCLPLKPFKIEREWESSGLQCAVVVAREACHRCGYVRVPPTHPLYGKDYDTPEVDVHGGLTFAETETCTDHPDGKGWWFGFDCAHAGDAMYDPEAKAEDMTTEDGRYATGRGQDFNVRCLSCGDHYWTQEEVVAETESLARQLAELHPIAA